MKKGRLTEGGQLEGETLQRVWCLIHDQNIQYNVILVHVDVRLSINRIREPSQLDHLTELCRRSVLLLML